MIEFLIGLFLTLQTGGDLCKLGKDADWYAWAAAHPTADQVVSYTDGKPNFWIYRDGDEVVLFVFRIPLKDVKDGRAHGECARLVDVG